jgi:uroporphyrinogen decarboxylase
VSKTELPLLAAFRGEKLGRVPFWEVWYGMNGLTKRLIGDDAKTPEQLVKVARILGWDAIRVGGASPGMPSKSEIASDGTRHYVQGGLTSLDQLRKPYPDVKPLLEPAKRCVQIAHDAGLATWFTLSWCFHAVTTGMGLGNLALKCYDDIGFLHAAFEWVERFNRIVIPEVILPSGVDFVLVDGDCAFKNGLMVHPRLFRELVYDRTKETVKPLREAGIPYAFHSDGKVDDFAPILIELGFSAMHGIEAQANDLGDIKRRFGQRICLVGNMDVVFLSRASVSEVRREAEQMLATGAPGGRYVAACNTSPLDYIPHENYLAMADAIRSFRT